MGLMRKSAKPMVAVGMKRRYFVTVYIYKACQ